MAPYAKLGCSLSATGLVTGVVFTLITVVSMLMSMFSTLGQMDASTMDGSSIRQQLMESIYGEDYKTLFQNYGIDYDSLFD